MTTIQLEKMSEHVGTEMLGLDLNNLTDGDVAAIKAELAARGLVAVSYTHLTLPTSDLV